VSPHRTPGKVEPDGPAPLPEGPAAKCPACGSKPCIEPWGTRMLISPLPDPRACTPKRRIGWLWWKCRTPGKHLHERCKVCGLDWLTAFAEGT
jgi:hypothetical protein